MKDFFINQNINITKDYKIFKNSYFHRAPLVAASVK